MKFDVENFRKKIFSPAFNFEEAALELFRFQSEHVEIYKQYISLLKIIPQQIESINEIPFLPIAFFKTHKVISDIKPQNADFKNETIFISSGTTGAATSKHYVNDLSLYEESFTKGFENFYGNVEHYCIIAFLPSYLEREGSSLIYMADHLIKKSKHPGSGFYLDDLQSLNETLKKLQHEKQKTILLGVTYALLDLAEYLQDTLQGEDVGAQKKSPFWRFGGIIMESGGMKGRRREMVREEVHKILCNAFSVEKIHSEYGMTELLSQAYSKGEGIFQTPPWMRVLIRDINDSKTLEGINHSGGINIIDLANVYSCAFIATQDLGKKNNDETFQVLGRFDNSDLRGCNMLVD